ncbi:MAG: hypothetical protein FJ104_14680, partial [Deltaproteobacteria bacterium]|nr:hypothetical protein [Deltaproteobacteria bacterium]
GELAEPAAGALAPGAGRLGWSGREWLMTYAALLRNFLESYRVAARGLGALSKGPLAEKELLRRLLDTGQRMFFTGEIERAEAVSQPNLKNALASFVDHGLLRLQDGKLELTVPAAEAVAQGEALVSPYLDREVVG